MGCSWLPGSLDADPDLLESNERFASEVLPQLVGSASR